MTGTYTTSSTFSITHARYIASKVAADLSLCAGYYGRPSATDVADYAEEFAQLLSKGYVSQYEFGFKLNGKRTICWRYTVDSNGGVVGDGSAGKLFPHAKTRGASYYNFMSYSAKWDALSASQKLAVKRALPVQRTAGTLPEDGDGVWVSDRSYSSGGVTVSRGTFKPNVA